MFKLHIYNPEHDIALAKNIPMFTPPKAARITREKYCHIPAFWADDGDWVLVDEAVQKLSREDMSDGMADVRFVTIEDLRLLTEDTMPSEVLPWGWDRLIVNTLLKANPLFAELVPSDEQLDRIRTMSSRQFVAENILPELVRRDNRFVGEMQSFSGTIEVLELLLAERGTIVAKSPWSCSGRGVRFLHAGLSDNEKGWIINTIKEQGCLMLEPLYNNVLDFAMEFHATKDGVSFQSLNIFETKEGKYLGNIKGTQEDKLRLLTQYIPEGLVLKLRESIIDITTKVFGNSYVGPFGIDAMIVQTLDNKTRLHPCVELNLRRTMGQVCDVVPLEG